MPAPPLTAGTGGAGSAIGDLLASSQPGAGADAMRQQLETVMGQIRDVGAMVDAIAADVPTLAAEAAQVKTLLKQMVVKAAQQAPTQTASGLAVPGSGGVPA